jgi:hypothetical protein
VSDFGISSEELKGSATREFSETETLREDLPVNVNRFGKLHVDIPRSGSVKWWASVFPVLNFLNTIRK